MLTARMLSLLTHRRRDCDANVWNQFSTFALFDPAPAVNLIDNIVLSSKYLFEPFTAFVSERHNDMDTVSQSIQCKLHVNKEDLSHRIEFSPPNEGILILIIFYRHSDTDTNSPRERNMIEATLTQHRYFERIVQKSLD